MGSKYTPYKKGYTKVTDGHRLYYELWGNPKGVPVVYVHGGPGGGFSDRDKNFFDKKKHNVLLFEQRGSGRSKPFGSTKANTTQKLVKDMNFLFDKFGFEKVYLFGGSWGSTLSLVYAVMNPERVKGMILRGIFLANKKSKDHFVNGGIKDYYPDVYERFVSLVPKNKRKDICGYYLSKMKSKDKKVAKKYAYEWALYEMSFMSVNGSLKKAEKALTAFKYESLSILEAHFIGKDCFIPENFILKNIKKIEKIPISITHGRFDFICQPREAFELHKKLKNSKLHIVNAGHYSRDKEIKKLLIKETKRIVR